MIQTVLIVASDRILQRSLARILSTNYKVIVADEGSVTDQVLIHLPDLVVLDQIASCADIRQQWPSIVIIVISVQEHGRHIVRALDLGADDYIMKPFSDQELKARVRAHLRRATQSRNGQEEPDQLISEDGHIALHIKTHKAYVGDHLVRLTPTEFALLWQLLLHAGTVLTHRSLLQTVWGPEYGEEEDYLRVYVRQIRRKIEETPSQPHYLLTASGVGYVFRCSPALPSPTISARLSIQKDT